MTSNLVAHAERELDLLGYPKLTREQQRAKGNPETDDINVWMRKDIMDMVKIFSKQGHSGASAGYAIGILRKLLSYENLSPLTDDPSEWIEVADDLWQNKRNSTAFSFNAGKTYYFLDEETRLTKLFRKLPYKTRAKLLPRYRNSLFKFHTSVHKEEHAEEASMVS